MTQHRTRHIKNGGQKVGCPNIYRTRNVSTGLWVRRSVSNTVPGVSISMVKQHYSEARYMIEHRFTNEWNVQMRTSKHNCDHWVVTMET